MIVYLLTTHGHHMLQWHSFVVFTSRSVIQTRAR